MRDTDVLLFFDITVSIEKSRLSVVVSDGLVINMLRANGLVFIFLSHISESAQKQATLFLKIGLWQLLLRLYLIPKLLRLDLNLFLPGILNLSSELLAMSLDYSFNFIDNVIDLMLAELWHVSLRWKRAEWLYNDLTLAYQSYEFDIIIPVALPGRIGYDLIQFLEPAEEANLDVFWSMRVILRSGYGVSDGKILKI